MMIIKRILVTCLFDTNVQLDNTMEFRMISPFGTIMHSYNTLYQSSLEFGSIIDGYASYFIIYFDKL